MSDDEANECVRISWCHMTPEVDWEAAIAFVSSGTIIFNSPGIRHKMPVICYAIPFGGTSS